jgi:RNA polymerase sigma factor (sigma-70 family)
LLSSVTNGSGSRRFRRLDDQRLATLVADGDAAAFEALYDRHHAPLLAFCRHMVGNREDAEDALQQAFLRAHRALCAGSVPDLLRPWLYAIARNRCRTLLAARRDLAVPADELEPSFDGLSDDVRRRSELRELVSDIGRLPEDQRGALVLAELGDLSHAEIAAVIGCPAAKVKALVFQARSTLIAEREARCTPCEEIRGELEVAKGGALRRGLLRRHLSHCPPCRTYRLAVSRRGGLASILPVAPTVGLKSAVLGGAGGGASAAAGGGAVLTTGAGGTGVLATGGGLAVKAVVAKVAVTVAVAGAGVGGGVAVVAPPDGPTPAAVAQRVASTSGAKPPDRRSGGGTATTPVSSLGPEALTDRPAGRLRKARRHLRRARQHRRARHRRHVRHRRRAALKIDRASAKPRRARPHPRRTADGSDRLKWPDPRRSRPGGDPNGGPEQDASKRRRPRPGPRRTAPGDGANGGTEGEARERRRRQPGGDPNDDAEDRARRRRPGDRPPEEPPPPPAEDGGPGGEDPGQDPGGEPPRDRPRRRPTPTPTPTPSPEPAPTPD